MINQLLELLDLMEEKFEKAKNDYIFDFYDIIVPFVNEVDALLEKLINSKDEILSLRYMNEKKFTLLVENYKELSVECHYKKTSKKIFHEKFKAVKHDLNYIDLNWGGSR